MLNSKKCLSAILTAGPVLLLFNSCSNEKQPLPNVVFILADDIGPGDIAVYHRERTGQKEIISTPNIDRLAEQGIRFRNAHTPAAMSAPTRYSVLTGNYCYRCRQPWGIWDAFDSLGSVAPLEKTVANVMKDAGYYTGFWGKWNLGSGWNRADENADFPGKELWDDGWDYSQMTGQYPNTLGFDYSYMLPQGIQALPLAFYRDGKLAPIADDSEITVRKAPWDSTQTLWRKQYRGYMKADSRWDASIVGAKLTADVVDFIHKRSEKNPGKPFFVYYCSQAVHVPHEPPADFYDTPVKGTTVSIHGDMIFELDLQVGKIIEALKATGELDNTLIIFTSDNGGLNLEKTNFSGHSSSNGFREKKSYIYEGGTRVPFIAMWPGMIPEGLISDEKVMAHDLMAAMYALTGQDMPDDQGRDSYNILPLLKNERGAEGRDIVITQGNPARHLSKLAIQKGDWKLIINSDQQHSVGEPFALFNLKENPYEKEEGNHIKSSDQQEKINELYSMYSLFRNSGERTTKPVRHNR